MTDELNAQKVFLTWEESAAVLQTDAKHGIARAQRLLAMRYLRGRGVPKDQAIAFYWMQLAAQQHFSLAQRSLGDRPRRPRHTPWSNFLCAKKRRRCQTIFRAACCSSICL